jgi:hypothetical protein
MNDIIINTGFSEHQLNLIIQKLNTMPTLEQFNAAFAQINDSTNNIAADITRLTQQLQAGGLSATEQQAVFDQLNGVAAQLQQIAAVTPE